MTLLARKQKKSTEKDYKGVCAYENIDINLCHVDDDVNRNAKWTFTMG